MPVHSSTHQAELPDPPSARTVGLWLGLLGAPVVLLAGQWVGYALVPDACDRQSTVFVHLVHAVALLLMIGAVLLCHAAWKRLGRGEADERPGPEHRARYMAFSGMIGNGFFLLGLGAQGHATFRSHPSAG
jgi:hypothetical protein